MGAYVLAIDAGPSAVRYHSRTDRDSPAGYRARPFRELLAMSVVAVGLLATVTWMVFLVSGFRWVGASGFKWLVNFF